MRNLARKVGLTLLILITVWFSVELFSLSLDYVEETLSIVHFKFIITDISKHGNDTLIVTFNFNNPTPRNVGIFFLTFSVYCDNDFIGSRSVDYYLTPFVVENRSERVKEESLKSKEIVKYAGREGNVLVQAQVILKTTYLGNIPRKADYTKTMVF